MSHFSVAVLHYDDQSVETLLEPFDENMPVPKYVEYTKQQAIDYAREHFKDYAEKSDEECWNFMADGAVENGMTDDGLWGNIYSECNPESRWDWYEIGGRWDGFLNVSGMRMNSAKISNIDFSVDEKAYKEALEFWDHAVEHKGEPDEKYTTIYTEDYYRSTYLNRENFAKSRTQFSTFAVITPDGEWHEKGRMGWFGVSSETPEEARDWEERYFERFIKNANPDLNITIVDCHI